MRLAKTAVHTTLQITPPDFWDWSRTDLREHCVGTRAQPLGSGLESWKSSKNELTSYSRHSTKLDKDDRTAILVQMIIAEGRAEEDVGRSDFADRTARLNQEF